MRQAQPWGNPCLGPLWAWSSWQPTVCVSACVGANPSNICQALCAPRSSWLQGWDGWVVQQGTRARGAAGVCQGSLCKAVPA